MIFLGSVNITCNEEEPCTAMKHNSTQSEELRFDDTKAQNLDYEWETDDRSLFAGNNSPQFIFNNFQYCSKSFCTKLHYITYVRLALHSMYATVS